jgi:hypothetical protein
LALPAFEARRESVGEENTAFAQSVIGRRAVEVAPFIEVKQERPNRSELRDCRGLAEPYELRAAALELDLDHKEIEVAV